MGFITAKAALVFFQLAAEHGRRNKNSISRLVVRREKCGAFADRKVSELGWCRQSLRPESSSTIARPEIELTAIVKRRGDELASSAGLVTKRRNSRWFYLRAGLRHRR